MKDVILCTCCGFSTFFEDAEVSLAPGKSVFENAEMTCPVCNSKFDLSAVLTQPGETSEFEPVDEPLELPEPEGEEEEEPIDGEEDDEDLQITAKENIQKRIDSALKEAEEGADSSAVMSALLRPMKISSITVLNKVEGTEYDYLAAADAEGIVIRLQDWLGADNTPNIDALMALTQAFIMDPELFDDFSAMVTQGRADYGKEIGAAESKIKEGKYVDSTPSPSEYRHMLNIIIRSSKSKADRDWAKEELADLKGVKSWKSPRDASPAPDKKPAPIAKDRMHSFPQEGVNARSSLKESMMSDMAFIKSKSDEIKGDTKPRAALRDPDDYNIYKDVDEDGNESYAVYKKNGDFVGTWLFDQMEDEFETRWDGQFEEGASPSRQEAKKVDIPDEWKGEFANFNAKIFSACEDLELPTEEFENVIQKLQDKEAISLNQDMVVLDLKKTKECFVDLLNNPPQDALAPMTDLGPVMGEPAEPVPELAEPVAEPVAEPAPDLGSGPIESAINAKLVEEEEEDSVEKKVEQIIMKYFV